uniref:ShKT domain-containing protein n=1 Tax=Acrobeloides nanus TaxID=290746 RepID=A0A914C7A3_9BILA
MYAIVIFGLAFIYYAYPACVDLTNASTGVSDCSRLSYLCNNTLYYTLMTQQCPATCGRCSTTTNTTTSTTCVDLTNPLTGVSDCSSRAYLCNNTLYYTLMTQQCPATCRRCSTTTNTTTTTTCVDLTNPLTGVSDCSSRAYLCNNTIYYTLMTQQCPATCGRCTSGK